MTDRPKVPPAGMPGMKNVLGGAPMRVNRNASRMDEVPGAVTSAPPAATAAAPGAGASGPASPTIVRPTISRVISQGGATVVKKDANQAKVNLSGMQVGRWYSGDPGTARSVRVTVSGTWSVKPGLTGAHANALGVMVFVQWGSQSGGTQKAWFPVPCDFQLSATDVQVSATICKLPYGPRPLNFSGTAIPVAAEAQIVCSIAENESDGPLTFMLAGGLSTGVDPSGSNRALIEEAAIVTDLLLQNTGSSDTYVGLMDIDPALAAGTTGPLVMTPVLVKANSQTSVAWDGLAIFNAPFIGCFTSADGLTLDTANAASVFYEIRGWTPGFQGGTA